MVTPSKGPMLALLDSVRQNLLQATADPSLCWRLLDPHRQVWVSLLWGHCPFLLSPGVHNVLFVPFKSVSPVLCKFCNQIPLASKDKFPGGSQSLCQIPRLENLLWALEILQQCKNFYGIIFLQFLHCLFGGCMVGLTHHVSQICFSQSHCHYVRPLLACASEGDIQTLKAGLAQSLWGLWVLVCTRFCLSPLSISGGYGI